MKPVNDLTQLFKRPFLQNLRNPAWLFVSGSTPLMYLILFMPLLNKLVGSAGFPSGAHVIQIFLPGIIALLAFGSSNFAGFGTIFLLRNGFIERLRVTPASRFAILMGPIFSSILWTLIFATVIIVLSVPFGFHIYLGGLIIYAVLLSIMMVMFSAVSTSLAILTKEISTFAAIVNGFNLPLILLAGVMLPIALAPQWMQVIAHFNPLYYIVSAGRALSIGQIANRQVLIAFAVIVPLTLVVIWWSMRVLRKAVA